jgi:hypothetical protein
LPPQARRLSARAWRRSERREEWAAAAASCSILPVQFWHSRFCAPVPHAGPRGGACAVWCGAVRAVRRAEREERSEAACAHSRRQGVQTRWRRTPGIPCSRWRCSWRCACRLAQTRPAASGCARAATRSVAAARCASLACLPHARRAHSAELLLRRRVRQQHLHLPARPQRHRLRGGRGGRGASVRRDAVGALHDARKQARRCRVCA